MKHVSLTLTALLLMPLTGLCAAEALARVFNAQGEMAGEVTPTTVILQSRLTASPGLQDGDVPGAAGWGRFEYGEGANLAKAGQTDWLEAKADNDFIVRTQLRGLTPGRTYFYRLVFGVDRSRTETGPVRKFKTLAAAEQAVPVRFVVGNCMNYAFYFNGPKGDGQHARTNATDRQLGYPAMESIRKIEPDFFVGAGDNVYYDHPAKKPARTLPELRRKWHEQFVLPRVVELVGQIATFWLKDDHDYRFNDGDRTGDRKPVHNLGVRTFREQMPVVATPDSPDPTYRTVRCGKLVQIWMVEGRDYRSPNKSPDDAEKTIWGADQKAWLERTLLASDATFKILMSPTPLIGPDEANEIDNHASGRSRHEGEEFLAWRKTHEQKNLYLITGDRHWHYHSVHPTGAEEFSCGALHVENARVGLAPGNPRSSDPEAKVKQLYTDAKPKGGYLLVEAMPGKDAEPARLHFSIQDEWGKELYAITKPAFPAPPAAGK